MFQLLALGVSPLTLAHSHTTQHLLVLLILIMKGWMSTNNKMELATPLTRKGVIARGDDRALNTIVVGEILKALVWRLRRGNSY